MIAAFTGLSWVAGGLKLLASPLVRGLLIAALALAVVAYARHDARVDERARLQVDALRATIAELQRQRAAADKVAEGERARAAARARRIEELNKRLAEHGKTVEAEAGAGKCRDVIDAPGRERMLELRRGS